MGEKLAVLEARVTRLEQEGTTMKEEIRLLLNWLVEERWGRRKMEEKLQKRKRRKVKRGEERKIRKEKGGGERKSRTEK